MWQMHSSRWQNKEELTGVPASSAAAISWPWQRTGVAVYSVGPLEALQSTSLAARNCRCSLCDRNKNSLSLHQPRASRLNERPRWDEKIGG